MTLRRQGAGEWSQHVASTRLWPLRQDELTAAVATAGFSTITCYGGLSGAPFESDHSPNLVVTARRED